VTLTPFQEELRSTSRWDFSDLRALYVNCTLKPSPELSHTEGLMRVSMAIMERNGVDADYIRSARAFHFGTISLISERARSAALQAVKIAREAGLLISFDPNLRLNLWPDADAARTAMQSGWSLAHVIKVSEEELEFLSQTADLAEAARKLWHDDLRVLIITRGKAGCRYVTVALNGEVTGFDVAVTDTTGAGDGFVAGLLKGLLAQPDAHLDEDRLRVLCRYANAVGALTTTRRGAIPALPTAEQVEAFLSKQP